MNLFIGGLVAVTSTLLSKPSFVGVATGWSLFQLSFWISLVEEFAVDLTVSMELLHGGGVETSRITIFVILLLGSGVVATTPSNAISGGVSCWPT
jgi:hypothetical protein